MSEFLRLLNLNLERIEYDLEAIENNLEAIEQRIIDMISTSKKKKKKRSKTASKMDLLAKREALYDYEIAALTLSKDFLKTRNKAYYKF